MPDPQSLDLGRIKGNVAKMVSMGAPEEDVDAYIAGEGTSVDAVRAYNVPKNDSRETSAPAAPETVWGDVAKSAATAAPEAVARTASLPATIERLGSAAAQGAAKLPVRAAQALGVPGADKAMAYMEKAYATPSPATAALQAADSLPAVKKGIDTGLNAVTPGRTPDMSIFYKPKTPWGGMAQEGVVGALMGGPFGAAGAGALGGVGGEGARRVFEGTPLEVPASIVGGMVGASLPAVARYVGAVSRPGDILARGLEGVDDATMAKAEKLMQDAKAMGVDLTGPEAIQQAMGGQTRLGTLQRQVEMAPGGEGIMRPTIAARPGQVRRAGEELLDNTFGPQVPPERAVAAAQGAGETLVDQAMKSRTALTSPGFGTAKVQAAEVAGLDDLVKAVDAKLATAGPETQLGRALKGFRAQLTQVEPDAAGKLPLGPLMTANRETAWKLAQKYNPAFGPDQPAFQREIAAELAPLNKQFTDILSGASPDYGTALKTYQAASPAVTELYEGPVGRLARGGSGDPATQLRSMADEFLDPNLARPAQIRKLAADLAKADPKAVPQLVGARIGNVFDNATKELQSGANPWGGARFVTEVMGNPQARANLEATIKTLPSGGSLWSGWVKFAEVMKATGKRLPRGSDTALNLGMAEELKKGASLSARVAGNPLGALADASEQFFARRNASELAKVFTDPQSVSKMRELALLNPKSRTAQLLVAEILALAGAEQRQEPVRITITKDKEGK